MSARRLVAAVLFAGGALVSSSCSDGDRAAPPPSAGSPDRARLFRLRNLGKVHYERDGEDGFRDAATALREAATLSGDEEDRLNLARVLMLVPGGAEEADRILAALSAAPKSSADRDYVAALVKKRLGDDEGAWTSLARASAARPDHPHVWLQRGRAEAALGRDADALVSLDRALALKAHFRAAAYHRFVALDRLNLDEAARAAKLAFEAIPATGQPDSERCDLTHVSLRRQPRTASEPATVALDWRAVAPEDTGASSGPQRDLVAADLDRDGRQELLTAGPEGVRIARFDGRKMTVTTLAPPCPSSTAIAVGDLDNDGRADLVLSGDAGASVRFGLDGGAFAAPTSVPDLDAADRILLVDLDHDGDVDLLAIGPSRGGSAALRTVRNNGDRTFAPQPSSFRAPPVSARGVDFHDLDQGNDVDIVAPGSDGRPTAYMNLRDRGFAATTLDLPAATHVLAEDLDGDGAPDVLSLGGGTVSVAYNADRSGDGGAFRARAVRSFALGADGRDVVLADVDDDGDEDAIAATANGLAILRNRAGGDFTVDPQPIGAAPAGLRRLAAGDGDGDGRFEIWTLDDSGRLSAFVARRSPEYMSVDMRPDGRKDNRGGVGTVVELFAGPRYQSAMIKGPDGRRFGLGSTARAGVVDGWKLRWPQGISQAVTADEPADATTGELKPRQREGLVASCPFLYGRGPAGMRFLTDVVAIAPLDEWTAAGSPPPSFDPEEWVRIPGDALTAIDGRIELALTEELRETTYLDQLVLTAVEHPDDVDVFADESTRQGKFDPLVVFATASPRAVPVARAETWNDVDCTSASAVEDRLYVRGYPPTPTQWDGFTGRYDLVLRTAAPATTLLLTGRVAWYDSTTAFSLAQNGRGFGPLRLDVREPNGTRRTLAPDIGLPAGMDRTMVVRFSDAPLAAGTELILSGAHRLLWDRIATTDDLTRFDFGDGDAAADLPDGRRLKARTTSLLSATLGEFGFARPLGDRANHETNYDYAQAAPDDSFRRAVGRATRYGDVMDLLNSRDDRFVVLVAGDQATLCFAAPPPPESGRRRTWFLRVTGYAKEGGFHNPTGRSIEPLPFRGMSRYPPPSMETPDTRSYREYLDTFQTRIIR